MTRTLIPLLIALTTTTLPAQQPEPAWMHAAENRGAMSAEEIKAFMKRLAQHAVEHHMKKAEGSPQRGMMYEYLRWNKRGQPGQFIQGEALDTMHDGAWFAVAMCNAWRATGDAFYKDVLVKWQLPFYLKMLNEGAQLFSDEQVDVRPELRETWKGGKEWLLQGRENGFVPYWWDDGESVSLEMLGKKSAQPFFPCTNDFAGQPNPDFKLKGYSHGSSNHLAQDLGVMLLQSWLVLHDSKEPADQELAKQVAIGAKNFAGVPRASRKREHPNVRGRVCGDQRRCRHAGEARQVGQGGSPPADEPLHEGGARFHAGSEEQHAGIRG
jgi:hypothetical protein